jgi:hypothetical protein
VTSAVSGGSGSSSTTTIQTSATTTVSTSTSQTGTDTVAPVVTLTGPSSVSVAQGGLYTEEGATATDDVDTTIQVVITGAIDTTTPGTYTITYTATDSAGNAGTATRDVVVTATAQPSPAPSEPLPAEPAPSEPAPPVTP